MDPGSAGYMGGMFARKYSPVFFKKIGTKELSQEEIERIVNKEYPRKYKHIYDVVLISFVIPNALISCILPLFVLIPFLQFFGNTKGETASIMLIFSFIIPYLLLMTSCMIAFYGLFQLILNPFLSKDLEDYAQLKSIEQGWAFDTNSINRKFFYIGVICFIIGLLAAFLGGLLDKYF